MSDRIMTGAELKVQLTGMGVTPAWLADRLGVASRTIIRWCELDRVPAKAVAEIDWLTSVTNAEMASVLGTAHSGTILTQRIDREGVAYRNTLPASWHRALTFRVLEQLRAGGVAVRVGYIPHR